MKDLDSAGVFNLFMPVRYLDDEMDVLVAATSCPEGNIVNDFDPKGMLYQIFD